MSAGFRVPLRVPATHPALDGHFPGRPVVPGVLILDCLAAALEARGCAPIAAVVQAKFLAPLAPDEAAELACEPAGGELRFRVERGGEAIAEGRLRLAAGAP